MTAAKAVKTSVASTNSLSQDYTNLVDQFPQTCHMKLLCANVDLLVLEVSIQPNRVTASNRLNTNLVNPLKAYSALSNSIQQNGTIAPHEV